MFDIRDTIKETHNIDIEYYIQHIEDDGHTWALYSYLDKEGKKYRYTGKHWHRDDFPLMSEVYKAIDEDKKFIVIQQGFRKNMENALRATIAGFNKEKK